MDAEWSKRESWGRSGRKEHYLGKLKVEGENDRAYEVFRAWRRDVR